MVRQRHDRPPRFLRLGRAASFTLLGAAILLASSPKPVVAGKPPSTSEGVAAARQKAKERAAKVSIPSLVAPPAAAVAANANIKKAERSGQKAHELAVAEPVLEPVPNNATIYAEELTTQGFIEKVQQVANVTGSKPLYYPVVLFHVSWCDYCTQALPEFQEAAMRVFKAVAAGQVLNYPILPRFFIFHCQQDEGENLDGSLSSRDICKQHAGGTYPSLRLFRDKRTVVYNRPRFAVTIAWWAVRVTRPAVIKMSLWRHLDNYAHEITFMLFADHQREAAAISAWTQIALGYLDMYNFALVHPDSKIALSLFGKKKVPSLHLHAPPAYALSPLPLKGPLCHQNLKAWVNFNQFPPMLELSALNLDGLQRSGLRVITLVHTENHGATPFLKEYEAWVKKHRRGGRYIFAALNATDIETLETVQRIFPLLLPPLATLPRLFVFKGKNHWEDPELVKPFATLESLEALQNSNDAMQDGTWFRRVRKGLRIIGAKSWKLALPSFILCFTICCWGCCGCCIQGAPQDLPALKSTGGEANGKKVQHIE